MLAAAAYTAALLVATVAQPVAAIDYLGGWLASPPKEQCVDICVNSNPAPYCFVKTDACLAKKQRAGDFDWMVLEELFIPQYCRDLLQGVDTTISHQNVNKYPNGIVCNPQAVKSELTIHGLWPNYDDGYAGCCNVTETIANKPYDAAQFARKYPKLLKVMKDKWVDPTQESAYDSLCEIYNHEFQKHGVCYNAFGANMEKAAVNYFRATLTVAYQLKHATRAINRAARKAQETTVDAIKQLYSKNVMVFCSAVDGSNQLSVIRTCWDKPAQLTDAGPFVQRDCAEPKASAMFTPCDATKPVTLHPYVAQATAF